MSSFAPESKGSGQAAGAEYAKFDGEDAVYFGGIGKVPYKPDAGPAETLAFKHYNPTQVVMGRTMEDWLRFSVCFWHTFRGTGADPFGFPTLVRPWDDGSDTMANAKRRLRAAFEFFTKLGVKYWCFHDRDISPEGNTLEETNKNLDEISDLALELQKKTGVKLLWATSNLFAHPRYMNGAASNPNAHIFAFAAAQVKKCMEIAKKLGAENFGYQDIHKSMDEFEFRSDPINDYGVSCPYTLHYDLSVKGDLLRTSFKRGDVSTYKKKIGFNGVLLIEPKPKEPTKHQYDYDAMTVIAFLKHYGLDKDYKLNIEPNHTTLAGHGYEHDVVMASAFGMLGSVDSNTGSPDLGWDTDQFPMDIKNCTLVMKTILEQGGLAPGGLNFDCKVRRESTNLKDMFISHIGAMDSFARGLKVAAKLKEEGVMDKHVKTRYSSFESGIGQKIDQGTTSFEELEKYVLENGNPQAVSGEQEHYESMLNYYV